MEPFGAGLCTFGAPHQKHTKRAKKWQVVCQTRPYQVSKATAIGNSGAEVCLFSARHKEHEFSWWEFQTRPHWEYKELFGIWYRNGCVARRRKKSVNRMQNHPLTPVRVSQQHVICFWRTVVRLASPLVSFQQFGAGTTAPFGCFIPVPHHTPQGAISVARSEAGVVPSTTSSVMRPCTPCRPVRQ